jgi:hypothetical protein
MTGAFEWRGENLFAIRGEDLFWMGFVHKRDGEDKWDAHAQGEAAGTFVTEEAARRRVLDVLAGKHPGLLKVRRATAEQRAYLKDWRRLRRQGAEPWAGPQY